MDSDGRENPARPAPPRTWRRAAWVAVGASCVVLTVLSFAATRLVGPQGSLDRIRAFPGLPTGGLLTPQPLGQPPAQPTPTATATPGPHSGTPETGSTGGGQRAGPHQGRQPQAGEQQEGHGDPSQPGTSAPCCGPAPTPTGQSAPPTVSVLPTTGHPPVTADDMVSATRAFYDRLPHDVDGAWAMLGPGMKSRGKESFHRQWAEVSAVHLLRVVVNADDSSAEATVMIVSSDGIEHVERYELVFRSSGTVVIDEIVPLGGDDGGNKPVK